jgi:hypothetical protein
MAPVNATHPSSASQPKEGGRSSEFEVSSFKPSSPPRDLVGYPSQYDVRRLASGIWRLGTAFGPFISPGNSCVGFAITETSRFARLFRNVRPPQCHNIDGPQWSRCSAEGLPRVQGYGTTRRYTGRIRAWGIGVPAVLPVFCFLSSQSPVSRMRNRGGDIHVAHSQSPSNGDEDIASPSQGRGGDVHVAHSKAPPMAMRTSPPHPRAGVVTSTSPIPKAPRTAMRTSPPHPKAGVATSTSPIPKAPPNGDEDIASPSQGRGGDIHVAHSQSPSPRR